MTQTHTQALSPSPLPPPLLPSLLRLFLLPPPPLPPPAPLPPPPPPPPGGQVFRGLEDRHLAKAMAQYHHAHKIGKQYKKQRYEEFYGLKVRKVWESDREAERVLAERAAEAAKKKEIEEYLATFLQHGWFEEIEDETGDSYYVHEETEKSTWKRPEAAYSYDHYCKAENIQRVWRGHRGRRFFKFTKAAFDATALAQKQEDDWLNGSHNRAQLYSVSIKVVDAEDGFGAKLMANFSVGPPDLALVKDRMEVVAKKKAEAASKRKRGKKKSSVSSRRTARATAAGLSEEEKSKRRKAHFKMVCARAKRSIANLRETLETERVQQWPWDKKIDERSFRTYYVNRVTGETSYSPTEDKHGKKVRKFLQDRINAEELRVKKANGEIYQIQQEQDGGSIKKGGTRSRGRGRRAASRRGLGGEAAAVPSTKQRSRATTHVIKGGSRGLSNPLSLLMDIAEEEGDGAGDGDGNWDERHRKTTAYKAAVFACGTKCCRLSPWCTLPKGHWQSCQMIKSGTQVSTPFGLGKLVAMRDAAYRQSKIDRVKHEDRQGARAIEKFWRTAFPMKEMPELHNEEYASDWTFSFEQAAREEMERMERAEKREMKISARLARRNGGGDGGPTAAAAAAAAAVAAAAGDQGPSGAAISTATTAKTSRNKRKKRHVLMKKKGIRTTPLFYMQTILDMAKGVLYGKKVRKHKRSNVEQVMTDLARVIDLTDAKNGDLEARRRLRADHSASFYGGVLPVAVCAVKLSWGTAYVQKADIRYPQSVLDFRPDPESKLRVGLKYTYVERPLWWEEQRDLYGRVFYRNSYTGEESWGTPEYSINDELAARKIQRCIRGYMGKTYFLKFARSQDLHGLLYCSIEDAQARAWIGFHDEGMDATIWLTRLGLGQYCNKLQRWRKTKAGKKVEVKGPRGRVSLSEIRDMGDEGLLKFGVAKDAHRRRILAMVEAEAASIGNFGCSPDAPRRTKVKRGQREFRKEDCISFERAHQHSTSRQEAE